MQTIEIDNGINLRLINSNKFKTTTICTLIRQPLKRETVTINSLLASILEMGCEKYKTISEIKNITENMYGAIFATQIVKKGEEQIIQFFMEIIHDEKNKLLEQAFEFISEVMLNPLVEDGGFNKEYVASEKGNLKTAIKSRINNKGEYAKLRCLEEMCKDEPFGIYGDGYLEDIDDITPKKLYEHYINLLETAPIDFLVVGDEKVENLESSIKSNFKFNRGKKIDVLEQENKNIKTGKVNTVEETLNLNQGKICIGARAEVPSKGQEFYDYMIASEILGGNPSSRLFLKVREEQSLCYYINSFIFRFKGILFIQSGVDKQNFEKVVKNVENEISEMQNGNIKEEQFENAKCSLLKKIKGVKDYPTSIIDFYASQFMIGDEDNIEDVLKKIENVKINSVKEVCKKINIDTIFTLK